MVIFSRVMTQKRPDDLWEAWHLKQRILPILRQNMLHFDVLHYYYVQIREKNFR